MTTRHADMSTRADAANPWLSVVMPAYRGEEWIGQALASIAAEADEGVEILVIDGGPAPATREIAESFASRVRLRVIAREDLANWQGKVNLGVQMARSTHVCLLCVDDVWLAGRATAIRSWINAAPCVALHLAPSTIIDRRGRKLGVWRCPLPRLAELSFETVAERLLVQNFIASPAPVFRRDAWLECGGLDETLWYTADWDIWLKLAAAGPTLYHTENTCGFRIHAGSLTVTGGRNSADLEQQMRRVLDRYLPRLRSSSDTLERAARTSIAVNVALASASSGSARGLRQALSSVLGLGLVGTLRFLRDSRLLERVAPRVLARLRGSF
jgi:hypothetical protein